MEWFWRNYRTENSETFTKYINDDNLMKFYFDDYVLGHCRSYNNICKKIRLYLREMKWEPLSNILNYEVDWFLHDNKPYIYIEICSEISGEYRNGMTQKMINELFPIHKVSVRDIDDEFNNAFKNRD